MKPLKLSRRQFLFSSISSSLFFAASAGDKSWALSAVRTRFRRTPMILGFGFNTNRRLAKSVGSSFGPKEVWAGDFLKVFAGHNQSWAVDREGRLWGWGDNTNCQVGAGARAIISTPILVSNTTGWKSILTDSLGNGSMALKEDGSMWAWGSNLYGFFADNRMGIVAASPGQIGSQTDWGQVTAHIDTYYGSVGFVAMRGSQLWRWGLWAGNASSPVLLSSSSWKKITGSEAVCAIRQDNTLWAWGTLQHVVSNQSWPVQLASDKTFKDVSVGFRHMHAIDSSGALWVQGRNSDYTNGRTAVSTDVESSLTQIGSATDWSRVFSSPNFMQYIHALKEDGTLWGWGRNVLGRLGMGVVDQFISTPTQVGVETYWKTLSLNGNTTLALTTSNYLYGWGDGGFGQLWTSGGSTSSPIQLGGDMWLSVSSGSSYCLGVKQDGTLWGWGRNMYNMFGSSIAQNLAVSSPVQIGSESSWAEVFATWMRSATSNELYAVSYARRADGTLWSWGANFTTTLGRTQEVIYSSPTQILSGTTWQKLSVGDYNVAAINSSEQLYIWGYNAYGLSLGVGTDHAYSSSPIQMTIGSTAWRDVALARPTGEYYLANHTQAIATSGRRYVWGYRQRNCFGYVTSTAVSTPVTVGSETTWAKIFAGGTRSYALKEDETLWTWGDNGSVIQVGTEQWNRVLCHPAYAAAVFERKSDGALFQMYNTRFNSVVLSSPNQIGSTADWKDLSLGADFALAIRRYPRGS